MVSLLGAVVPIPVTVKLDNVKVIRREEGEEGAEGEEEGEKAEETESEESEKDKNDEFQGPLIGGVER